MSFERPEIYAWNVYGLFASQLIVTSQTNLDIIIHVPEHSDFITEDGTEMAGEYLVRLFDQMLRERGIHNYTLKYSVRTGERWSSVDYDTTARSLRMRVP